MGRGGRSSPVPTAIPGEEVTAKASSGEGDKDRRAGGLLRDLVLRPDEVSISGDVVSLLRRS